MMSLKETLTTFISNNIVVGAMAEVTTGCRGEGEEVRDFFFELQLLSHQLPVDGLRCWAPSDR